VVPVSDDGDSLKRVESYLGVFADRGRCVAKADLARGEHGVLECGEGDLSSDELFHLALDARITDWRNLLVEICEVRVKTCCAIYTETALTIVIGRRDFEAVIDFDRGDLEQIDWEVSDLVGRLGLRSVSLRSPDEEGKHIRRTLPHIQFRSEPGTHLPLDR
jgi:hypothetical protein